MIELGVRKKDADGLGELSREAGQLGRQRVEEGVEVNELGDRQITCWSYCSAFHSSSPTTMIQRASDELSKRHCRFADTLSPTRLILYSLKGPMGGTSWVSKKAMRGCVWIAPAEIPGLLIDSKPHICSSRLAVSANSRSVWSPTNNLSECQGSKAKLTL